MEMSNLHSNKKYERINHNKITCRALQTNLKKTFYLQFVLWHCYDLLLIKVAHKMDLFEPSYQSILSSIFRLCQICYSEKR